MKKILLLLIACLFVSTGIQAQNVELDGISLKYSGGTPIENEGIIVLNAGGTATLEVVFDPANATNKSVTWKIEDDQIASIDTTSTPNKWTCIITGGLEEGATEISVKAEDGQFTVTHTVKVVKPVTGMVLNENTMNLTPLGKDTILIARINPSDATNDSIRWISRDSSIVNIVSTNENRYDSICNIVAVKPGVVWIVAETVDGGIKDSCEVTVTSATIVNFTLNYDSLELIKDSEATIIAQIRPLEGTYKSVNWINTNYPAEDIVEIISSGRDTICQIRAVGIGEAKIVAVAHDGQRDTCVVTVKGYPVQGMSLSNDSLKLKITTDTTLMAIINPHYATNDSIEWISNDSTIVDITSSVSQKNDTICYIKALRSGEAKIFARTLDGGYLDTCVVTVFVPVDSVVIRSDSMVITGSDERVHMNLKKDTVAVLRAIVYPDTATYRSLSWRTLGTEVRIDSIPTIHNDTLCYIKALKSGVDTIIVTSAEGIESRLCFIEIDPREVDSVKIDKGATVVNDTLTMALNGTFELITTIYPSNATNDSLKIESTDPEIARIDSTTNSVSIKALKAGVAIVYVRPMDGLGGKIDSCIVKVSSLPVVGMSLSADTIRTYEQSVETLIAKILPATGSNDSIVWSTNDNSVISIAPGNDTICTFTALRADTALIYAVSKENSDIKDSCVVIVQKKRVFLAADTTTANTGKIELSLLVPDDATFTGSFTLQLPSGMGLTKNNDNSGFKTALTSEFSETLTLWVTYVNDSTYRFSIVPKVAPVGGVPSTTPKKVMDIYYTTYGTTLQGSTATYEASLKNLIINFSDDTEVREEPASVKIKVYSDLVGNDIFDNPGKQSAYIVDGRLHVNSDKAETVYVYSMNGSLVYMKNKAEGPAVFDINTKEKILVVKGSSGWTGKVVNK